MSKKKTQQKAPVSKKDQQISEPRCCCSRQKSSTRIRCDENRVTIFGQVGQNENDKYTLEYAAKINDMPMSPEFFSQYYNKLDDQEDIDENVKQVVSHAVQVNIREHLQQPDRSLTAMSASNDQGIQCNFEKLSLVPDFHDADDSEETKVLKKCNSPVIVISVYPRPDVKISTDKVFKKSKPKFAKKYSSNVVPAANSKTSKEKKEIFQNRRSQSRSASPEAKEIEKDNTKHNLQPQRACRSKMKSSSNLSSTNRKIIKSEPEKINKKYTTELKQTLIDNFIKSMESKEDNYAKFLLSVPKSTASRITINLNKNKQSFDVASNSSKKEVDLKNIKNKFKDTRKSLADKNISINNDKVMSEKRSPKTNKGKMNTKSSYPKPMQLKPRDSLVVKHSREIRRSEIRESVQKINSEQKSGNADARKHYRGDDCPIDDPNVRDKEIQRLLGLTKKQTTRLNKASKTYQHCGFKKCSKAIIISVKKKRLPRSPFTQTNNIDQNNVLETLNVNLNEELVKVKGLLRSPISFDKPDNCINRALKSNSHRIDKGTKIISNVLQDFEYSDLRTNQSKLIYDYDFFHAQKPYKYRRSKLPIKRYNKTTMTAKNAVGNHLAHNRDKHHSSLKAVPVKIEGTNRKQLHFSKKIQTYNKYFEKYVQTEKNSIVKRQLKLVRDSNCKIKRNFNRLLNIDSERIIVHQDKNKFCLRPTVSAVDASYNFNSTRNSKLETPKSYLNQEGDGPDLKISKKQADVANSFHVIYKGKGHKRSVTPNLGTSFVSISVESSKGTHQRPHRGRKTFLLHIISYVIKKLKRSSSMLENHQLKKCSTPNSFDSYYVNSSLAPWDMSSVIYDTSASYYSNHSIHAVAKMKRGFLSSFCDVLARRKRQTVGK